MYRQVFTPDEQNNYVSIPRSWYGQEVEVLVFLTNEPMQSKTKPRYHWAEAAEQMHLIGDDTLLMPSLSNNENIDWWTWDE